MTEFLHNEEVNTMNTMSLRLLEMKSKMGDNMQEDPTLNAIYENQLNEYNILCSKVQKRREV